jgi:chromosome segregation ATPase
MIDLTLKNEIEKLVSDIFSKKEDTDKKEMFVAALEDAKTKLVEASASISDKDSEIEDLTSKLEEATAALEEAAEKAQTEEVSMDDMTALMVSKDEELATVKEELEAEKAKVAEQETAAEEADITLTTVKEEFETTSAELAQIKKDALVAERMASLEEAGLTRSDEAGVEAQREKVANLSDEDYASYKAELEAIKTSIIASLKDEGNTAPPNTPDTSNAQIINLEGDGEVSIKDIGDALKDLFYGNKEGK